MVLGHRVAWTGGGAGKNWCAGQFKTNQFPGVGTPAGNDGNEGGGRYPRGPLKI